MGNMTKNFDREEFRCKCGCGLNLIEPDLVNIIQELRDEIGLPIRISSGTRCPKHNARVGGTRNSFHLQGKAADLVCECGAAKLVAAVKKLRNEGKMKAMKYCIHYQKKNFVHIDVGRTRNNLYEVRG